MNRFTGQRRHLNVPGTSCVVSAGAPQRSSAAGASREADVFQSSFFIYGRVPKRSRALARAAKGRIAESLPEVTEGRRSAMRERLRSEHRESRKGDQ